MAATRTLTDHDLLTMQRRGQKIVEACNTWSPQAREAWMRCVDVNIGVTKNCEAVLVSDAFQVSIFKVVLTSRVLIAHWRTIARLDDPRAAPLHREQVVVGQSSRRCHVDAINTTQRRQLSIRLRLRLLLLQPRPARQRLRERLKERGRRHDDSLPKLAPQPPDARALRFAARLHGSCDRPAQ